MKTKIKRLSRKTISYVLAFLVLFSSLIIGGIHVVNAWNNGTWYLGNDVKNVWDNSASACTMTKSGTQYYYDFYLKSSDADVYYRPYEKDNYAMGPTAGNNTKVTTTGTAGAGYNDNRCWYFDTADLTTANTFYQVRIYIDTAGNSGNGWSWYSASSKTNLTPTITRDKTSITQGNSVSLTGGYSGTNIGTVKYNYQYSTNNSTWTTLNSTSQTGAYSWTPSSTGTYYVRVKATDTGVVKGTNARSDREYYSSSQTITVNPAETTYTVTKKYQVGGGTVTTDGTQTGVGSVTPTQMTFPTYRVANNIGYKLTGFSKSGVTIATQDLSTGIITCTATSNSAYITALYANEADYKQFYFKKPSGWGSTLYAYVWDNSTTSGTTVKNKAWRGATLVDGDYQAATGTRLDENSQQLDFVGSIKIQNGSNEDTYYYYKTYYTDYDRVIFCDDSSQTADLTIPDSNSKYYDQSSTSWKDLPASVYNVTISATDSSVSRVNNTGAASATGTVSTSSVDVNSTTTAEVTLTAPSGYTIASTPWNITGNVTVTLKTNTSSSQKTYTISATGNGSISPNFAETSRTITVYRRLYNTALTQQGSNEQIATYSAGISSYATIAQPDATSGYYTWNTYTLANGVQANPTSTTLTTRAALKVNAKTSGTYVVYEDYKETLNTITFKNDGHGSVKRGSTTIVSAGASNSGTTKIGNITAVTITAQASSGYEFDSWTITSGSGNVTITNASLAETTFKATGAATVKANFRAVAYTIGASFPSGNGYNSSCVVNTYASDGTTLKTGGQIGDTFQIRVTLASGYDVDSISFATGTGYATPTAGSTSTSGSTKIYNYTLGAGSAVATVTLKAAAVGAPTFQIERETADNTFSYLTLNGTGGNASGNIANLFYLQPINIKVTIDDYTTETADFIARSSNGSSSFSDVSASGQTNSTMNPLVINNNLQGSPTSTSYIAYQIYMTVTNAPAGVTAATLSRTYYIRIYYNTAQKAYLKMMNLCDCTVEETSTTASTYYNAGAPWEAFNSARSQAISDYKGTDWDQWPAYNSTSAQGTTLTNYYNNLKTKFDDLQQKAKTTTVYVLSKYQNITSGSSLQYMSIRNTRISSSATNVAHFNHCRQYHYYLDSTTYYKAENVSSTSTYVDHLMKYEGLVTVSSTNYYLYSFTYAGHSTVAVYDATGKTSAYSAARGLTGTVTGLTDFKDYYINVYNTNVNSQTVTSATDFVDLQTKRTVTGKVFVESGQAYNASTIRQLLGLSYEGSLNSTAPNAAISEVSFRVQTQRGVESYTNMLESGASWTPQTQGRYKVKYSVKYTYGTDADTGGGATFATVEKDYYIYVAWDEIAVYVDMNGNVGTPTLNFTYNSNKNLPCDMSLVSGSESIYEYTLDLKKLKNDYNIAYKDSNNQYQNITINKITVDGTQVGGTYSILTNSYMTGSAWFKANSTNMTTFQNISNGSARTSFRAVDSSGNYLKDGIKSVSGTGVITENDGSREIDGIYHCLYAAKDDELLTDFSYNVRATVNKEIDDDGTIYYFDRWMKMRSPDEIEMTGDTPTALTMANLTATGNEKADYNINRAPTYGEGDDDGDFTYVAVYKQAATGDVRVEIKYNFKDYDTADGNYIYEENKPTVDASYTKTVKIPIGSGQTYTNYNAVKSAIGTIAQNKMPIIKSNYFDYSYDTNNPATEVTDTSASSHSDANTRKIVVNATLKETAHQYQIVVVKGGVKYPVTPKGYYQQTVELKSNSFGYSNGQSIRWYTKNGSTNVTLGYGATYTARYVQSGYTSDQSSGDTIYIYVDTTSASVDLSSTVVNGYSEVYKDGDTDKVRHNFYIVDYFDQSVAANGTFIGAGTLYATTDSQGNYRQTAAQSTLDTKAHMQAYIASALGGSGYNSSSGISGSATYDVDFPTQTINNVGFRYLSSTGKDGKDILRYSDILKGYNYTFGAQMNNSESYVGQKLRVYSYFIYKNSSNQYKIVVSDTYAEVERYCPQSEQS